MELAAPEDVVVAEVVLATGAPIQRALLHTALAAGETLPEAQVRVHAVDGPDAPTLTFHPAADSLCLALDEPDPRIGGRCYTAETGDFLEPGARYDLDIRLDDGRAITGRTTVPAAFTVRQPLQSPCAVRTPSLELTWTRSDGTGAYQIEGVFENMAEGLAARGVVDPPDTLRLLGVAIGAADTTLVFPSELGTFDRFDLDRDLILALQQGLPDGATAGITIAAADPNFINWVRGGNFNPSGLVRVSSVRGDGIGVFGALVVRRVRLVGAGDGLPDCE